MQTLVAFAFHGNATEEAREGTARVAARYEARWSVTPSFSASISGTAGLLLWQGQSASLWPAWTDERTLTVASLYVPIGYDRLIAPEPLATAPQRLAETLSRDPEGIEELCAPFVLATLEHSADRLTLFTDILAVGRLFEARTSRGWVWSNRPEAALAFAGLTPRADSAGWAHIAVADELFGEASPYEGVRVIDAATRIRWCGRKGRISYSSIDTVASLTAADPVESSAELIEIAADQLTGIAKSVTRLYTQPPVVDLTGGRDSRLVAAAFIKSDADIILHTHDALPGDLETARELIGVLDSPPPHHIEHVATGGIASLPRWNATTSAAAWHSFAEGLRPYSYLHYRAPKHLDEPRPLVIGGAGGELAHGFFYPVKRADLEQLPRAQMLDAFTRTILQRYAPIAGPSDHAREIVRAHIASVLNDIAARGHSGATILDVFYLRERLRRWGSTGERPGVVSPLLASSFVRACLSLTPDQRAGNLLHRELTRRLVSDWADVPYFPGEQPIRPVPARPRSSPIVVRVADAEDRDEINTLIQDTDIWDEHFEHTLVNFFWASSTAGRTDARQERILRAVIWRTTFEDHLTGLQDRTPTRAFAKWAPPPGPTLDATATATATATAIIRIPEKQPPKTIPRCLARTPLWAELRDTPTGALIRALTKEARRRGVRI